MLVILLVFVLVGVFYERPATTKKADYLPAHTTVASAQTGQQLFQQYCTSCHGIELKGSDYGPSLLHSYYHPSHHADIAFYRAVQKGVVQHHWQFGDMPPVPELTPDDAAHLVKYVRGKQREAGLF